MKFEYTLNTFLAQFLKDSSWPQSSSPVPNGKIASPPSSSNNLSKDRANAQKLG